jgi:tripartite ATP-independent transporter DctP family solute receptor
MKQSITVCVLLSFFSAQAAEPAKNEFTATYKIAMTQTPAHPYALGANKFGDLVKERTNGRIQFKVFTDSTLAKGEREMLEGLQQGTIDIYVGSTGPVGNFSPSMLIVDLPFLFRDNDHVDKVLDGPIGKQLLADVDQAGLKGLAFWENGFRHVSNNKVMAKTPDEAKGMKLRTMENKVHMQAFKAAGLNPTPMVWGEVYSALQMGVIDGQENPIAIFYSSKLFETQKYLTLTGHFYSPALALFSQKKWNRIPKEDQEIIEKAALEAGVFERKLNRDDEEKKLKEIEGKGTVIVRNVNKEAWQKAMQPAFDEFAKQLGKDKIGVILQTK